MKQRIVIFDDNKNRRESLRALINTSPHLEVVGMFENCKNIVTNINPLHADVLLMDIDMPVSNGIDGVLQIRKVDEDIKIIMQTVFEDDEKIFASIQAGANGYILKKSAPQKILDAISDVLEGGAPLTPQVAQRVIHHFSHSKKVQIPVEFKLSDRETEILKLLSSGKSYKMIANDLQISSNTVNNHIKKIYKKLQVNSATEAIAKIKTD